MTPRKRRTRSAFNQKKKIEALAAGERPEKEQPAEPQEPDLPTTDLSNESVAKAWAAAAPTDPPVSGTPASASDVGGFLPEDEAPELPIQRAFYLTWTQRGAALIMRETQGEEQHSFILSRLENSPYGSDMRLEPMPTDEDGDYRDEDLLFLHQSVVATVTPGNAQVEGAPPSTPLFNRAPKGLTLADPPVYLPPEELIRLGVDPTQPYLSCRDGADRLVLVQGEKWFC